MPKYYYEGREYEAETEAERKGIPGIAAAERAGLGPRTRYEDQLAAAQASQLGVAEQMYGAAGEQGRLQAAQMRGEGLRQTLGGLGQGGMAARGAIMGAGQASWGAGREGSRIGSAERLAASEAYMRAQATGGQYAMSSAEAWRQRFEAEQQRMRERDAAYREKQAREEAAAMQLGGAVLAAGGSAVAGAAGPKEG